MIGDRGLRVLFRRATSPDPRREPVDRPLQLHLCSNLSGSHRWVSVQRWVLWLYRVLLYLGNRLSLRFLFLELL